MATIMTGGGFILSLDPMASFLYIYKNTTRSHQSLYVARWRFLTSSKANNVLVHTLPTNFFPIDTVNSSCTCLLTCALVPSRFVNVELWSQFMNTRFESVLKPYSKRKRALKFRSGCRLVYGDCAHEQCERTDQKRSSRLESRRIRLVGSWCLRVACISSFSMSTRKRTSSWRLNSDRLTAYGEQNSKRRPRHPATVERENLSRDPD